MPFRLSTVTQRFGFMERVLDTILGTHAFFYVSNALIASATRKEHLKSVFEALSCLKAARLRRKCASCSFAVSEVVFLGHLLTE